MIICECKHSVFEFTVCVYEQCDPYQFRTRAAVTCQTLSTNIEASLYYTQPNNIDDMPWYLKIQQEPPLQIWCVNNFVTCR